MISGTQLGHYEILSAIGKGGMGEVWKARDTKLGRDVAIKTLPQEFSQDPDRLARFEREAKLLASLNHPNIAAIYGLEEHNGTRFLVLELVEGETLEDRLKRGSVEGSLKLALQIAEALEAAHEKGVIHRDLKPGNINITPDGKVKVLDFGLAKALMGEGSERDVSNSPTLSMAATRQGIILGTAAYMSPEQAAGMEVNKSSDIWAFGVVLWEMLTGQRLFTGETATHVLASVLKTEPSWSELPPSLNPRIRFLLESCLEKKSKDRCQNIAEARTHIRKALAEPCATLMPVEETATTRRRTSPLPWVVAIVLVAVAAGLAGWYLGTPEPLPVMRSAYLLPDGQSFANSNRRQIALSPDGSELVYRTPQGFHLRSMNELEARLIPGTNNGFTNPTFSPDGQWLVYFSNGDQQLQKISVVGGTPVRLTTVIGNPWGISWDRDDTILFATAEGIMQVSSEGGEPTLLISSGQGATGLKQYPQLLPDGNTVLFSVGGGQVGVQAVDSDEPELLFPGVGPRYLPSGHIVYGALQSDTLSVVPFDASALEVIGSPVPLVEGVLNVPAFPPQYAVSDSGTLAYIAGTGSGLDRILAIVDRSGVVEPLDLRIAPYYAPRISHDGRRLAVHTVDRGEGTIWVYDLSGETQMRPLTGEGNNIRPQWTLDGERIAFASTRDGPRSIYWQLADGTGLAERLTTAEEGTVHAPESWSPDGTLSFVRSVAGDPGADVAGGNLTIWTVSVSPVDEPTVFHDETNSFASAFSPDGRWIAYRSLESDQQQVVVEPYPATGARYQVTQDGAFNPLWSPDGDELFYQTEAGDIASVRVRTDAGFEFGVEQVLPIQGFFNEGNGYRHWDIMPDGDHFLMVVPAGGTDLTYRPQINIVTNWFQELRERVPVP